MAGLDIVGRVLEKLGPLIQDEVNLHLNSKQEAATLASNLKRIKLVLEDAERKQLRDPHIKAWLEELQAVAYDVEDALDDWEAKNRVLEQEEDEETEKQATKNASAGANMSDLWEKVCLFVHSPCSCFDKVVEHRAVALEVKDLNEKIETIYNKGNRDLQLLPSDADDNNNNRKIGRRLISRDKTTSDFIKSRVHGREKDVENLKEMLLKDIRGSTGSSSVSINIPEVISIIGQGGLGKTTLARMIYDDEEVKHEFPVRMWVCVSDPFEEIAIARDIFEALEGQSPKVSGLEAIKTQIKNALERKSDKFLLVLDDVWTEDSTQWEPLASCLGHGVSGSKILVTTRKEKTSKVVGADRIYWLGSMEDEHCWSIISQIAFSGGHERDRIRLENVGWSIAEKCDGLPLAAQTLGGLLKGKRNVQDWRRVLESEIWELKDVENSLFRHFFLSYDELEPAARRCFSYCAVFPKDYRINVDNLIKIWMAQGFLSTPGRGDERELLGRDYFEDLAQSSFFQDFELENENGRVVFCKMHDIVHDFAQYLSRKECAIVEGMISNSSTTSARHISWLHKEGELRIEVPIPNPEKLRSLFAGSRNLPVDTGVIGKLKSVRALSLAYCDLWEIPEEIGNLIHLRYLDLTATRMNSLPEAICNLYNLETLILEYCYPISRLPRRIFKLQKLRHIFLTQEQIQYPPGLATMTNLRTLTTFYAAKEHNSLRYLKDLNLIEGMISIVLEDLDEDADVNTAVAAALGEKNFLEGLVLRCGSGVKLGVVEALRPHQELRTLVISVPLALPTWIPVLENLTTLAIGSQNGKLHKVGESPFPFLWKLRFLEFLQFSGPWVDGCLGNGFHGLVSGIQLEEEYQDGQEIIAFPALKRLSLGDCESWERWGDPREPEEVAISSSKTLRIMPLLNELRILGCPQLEALPLGTLMRLSLSSLQTIRIDGCPMLKRDASHPSGSIAVIFGY